MNVGDLVKAMESLAPLRFAAEWDNVGLLVGDPEHVLTRVLLAIDCTRSVLQEAKLGGCEAVVAYHPAVFQPLARVVAGTTAYEAARADIAIFSPHTAFDVAEGGTNDVLADALGMTERRPLRRSVVGDGEYKLVTFVPSEHVAGVSRALFEAGAGNIGQYAACSFRTLGTGTFFGGEGTSPAVGRAGQLEEVAEVRLETVVPILRVDEVLRALRAAHPYEEPAFDVVRLAAVAEGRGLGRVGVVPPATVEQLAERIKRALDINHVLVAGGLDRRITRVAVCAGSGGDLVPDAIDAGAQLLVTGEVRHHDALRAVASGLSLVCTLHSVSERA
ncbi:MAG: Nif3-like dinuclear metal center hexameric protein, partial [Myxococcota bacterium]|nr:Nif3-like dinuclear metal center hexameric protein [Myxococcota bacterium]